MAKKENENEFEDLNDGGSINEADDSFGLPDIDYQPIDRSDETQDSSGTTEPVESEESTVDTTSETTTEQTEDQAYMYAHRSEVESPDAGTDFATESSDESSENIFGSTDENAEEVTAVETDNEEADSGQDEYVPGSYTPKESSGGSNIGAIIGIIAVIILAGLGIWYFMYEQPRQAEIAAQEQRASEEAEQEARDRDAAAAAAEEQRLAEEQAAREAEEARLAEESAENEPGTIETISERTGRYYIIVTSSIDGDLAMDYARDLAAGGNSVKIIAPYGNVKFHRVAVSNVETLAEAESRMNELKAEYGDGVWVMRY
jgi:predicted  nucleic acid-binding Zn-ribbon protein